VDMDFGFDKISRAGGFYRGCEMNLLVLQRERPPSPPAPLPGGRGEKQIDV